MNIEQIKTRLKEYDSSKGLLKKVTGDHSIIMEVRGFVKNFQGFELNAADTFAVITILLKAEVPKSKIKSDEAIQSLIALFSPVYQCALQLKQANILSLENIKTILYGTQQKRDRGKFQLGWEENITSALKLLSSEGILTDETRERIVAYWPHPYWCKIDSLDVAEALVLLKNHGIPLIPENINCGIQPHLLRQLIEANIFNQDIFDVIFKKHRSFSRTPVERITQGILNLNRSNLLNPENIETILGHNNPDSVAEALELIHGANILITPEKRAFINGMSAHYELRAYNELLSSFRLILNEENLNNVNRYREQFYAITHDIAALPAHIINQEVFDTCIRNIVAGRNNSTYLRGLLYAAEQAAPAPTRAQNINPTQSTHTASVHRTASESASKLRDRYNNKISSKELDKVIQSIRQWADTLKQSSSSVELAAARGVIRLTDPLYFYTDPVSGVSTRQLIALCWIAIHDDQQIAGTLIDAKKSLCEGFYEAQREYNLDDQGRESKQNSADLSACTGGTFNKLLEKLVGIHPDVHIEFITKGTASLKLAKVVKEKTKEYFISTKNQQKLAEVESEKDVGPIWTEIKDAVIQEMSEFKSVFSENKEFLAFIDGGESTSFDFQNADASFLSSIKLKITKTEPSQHRPEELLLTSSSLLSAKSNSVEIKSTNTSANVRSSSEGLQKTNIQSSSEALEVSSISSMGGSSNSQRFTTSIPPQSSEQWQRSSRPVSSQHNGLRLRDIAESVNQEENQVKNKQVFEAIYKAMYHGETKRFCLFKSKERNFCDMTLEQIENHANKNPETRTHKAYEIYKQQSDYKNDDMNARKTFVFTKIHAYCVKNSGWFSKTNNKTHDITQGGERSRIIRDYMGLGFK